MKKITFSIDKYELEEINNSQFAKLRLYICHDLDNKNGSYLSLESIKQAEKSLYNKPIIMKLNQFGNDFKEHEVDTIPVGFIPEIGHNIHYEKIGDRTYIVADAIIWKHYSSSTLEIFARDDIKGISMEIQVFSEHEREDDGLVEIDEFCYLAVCLLGSRYETGMYGTTAKIVEFSGSKTLEDFNKEWGTYIMTYNRNKETSSSERINSRKKKNSTKEVKEMSVKKEENMSAEEVKEVMSIEDMSTEEMANKEGEVDSQDDVVKEEEMAKEEMAKEEMAKETSEEEKTEDFKEEEKETEEEEAKEEETETEEEENKEEMSSDIEKMGEHDNLDGWKERPDELLMKYNELMSAMLTMNSEKEEMSKELCSLREYKANIEKTEKFEKMKDTFSMLTNVLSKEEIDVWQEKAEKYESFNQFETDIKAFACDKLLSVKSTMEKTQFSKMAVNLDSGDDENSEHESVWTRIAKRVSK